MTNAGETNANSEYSIEVCNRLLRVERSASEIYGNAIRKFATKLHISQLVRIQREHEYAAEILEEHIRRIGGAPDSGLSAWGEIAHAMQSAVSLVGAYSAVQLLQTGEEIGERNYRDALEDEQVTDECKAMIRGELLPEAEEHILALKALQGRCA
jgi:hypothetical protein